MKAFPPNARIETTDKVPLRWKILPGTKGRVISDDRILTGYDDGDPDDDTRYTVELENDQHPVGSVANRIVYLGTRHMKLIGANG